MKIVRRDHAWRVPRSRDGAWIALESLARRHGYRVCEMCEELGFGKRHFHALFVRDVGLSPKTWLRQERMVVARHLLRSGASPCTVAQALGFSTLNNFRREFREIYGLSPRLFQLRMSMTY